MELNHTQKLRYNRHLILDQFGVEGQQRLLQAKVILIGAGGLGSPAAMYLAAAGVGTLALVDGDTVSITNLQRQILHSTSDIGRPKVVSAREKLHAINPDVQIITHPVYLSEDNALELIRPYDFVIDGTDNFAAKYLVNDACIMLGKPFSMGGISRYSGQLMTHVPGSACYRCLFPRPPAPRHVETCATVGVLGSVAGILGTLQATETIKYLAGTGRLLTDTLLTFDALTMQWQQFGCSRRDTCPVCGSEPGITELKEEAFQPCRETQSTDKQN